MDFYLFRSTFDPMLRAITSDQAGTMLPRRLGAWVPYGEPGVPMAHVTAVSGEIQEGLDARGYYLMGLGSAAS
jgi:hypothetical protein